MLTLQAMATLTTPHCIHFTQLLADPPDQMMFGEWDEHRLEGGSSSMGGGGIGSSSNDDGGGNASSSKLHIFVQVLAASS